MNFTWTFLVHEKYYKSPFCFVVQKFKVGWFYERIAVEKVRKSLWAKSLIKCNYTI